MLRELYVNVEWMLVKQVMVVIMEKAQTEMNFQEKLFCGWLGES